MKIETLTVGPQTHLERPEQVALLSLLEDVREFTNVSINILEEELTESPTREGEVLLTLSVEESTNQSDIEKQGYRIEFSENSIAIAGNSEAGLLYGIQTLRQRFRSGIDFQEGTIADVPDFEWRGFYHDVSRGKVPTLDTLKEIVDYLARYKANMLQLYIEHPFMFSFNDRIAQNRDGLTADEIKELQEYCKDRRIEFVPSLALFGHMGGVLSLPEYRHLADVEIEKDWIEMSWHERMKGATIDVSNPEAIELLVKMLNDYVGLFESKFVNVCADETYDLGMGKTKALAEKMGKGRLYLQHIEWLNELCKKNGKQMMFWGDIIKNYPELIPEIPKDAILLNWGYHAETDYESTKLFADVGLDFFVCPGTSGWNRIAHDINNASINITKYAEAGHTYGGVGILNTDWGDHGHVSPLGTGWHGIALGCAVGWNVENMKMEDFDNSWSAIEFGSLDLVKAHHAMLEPYDYVETWIKLYGLIDGENPRQDLPNAATGREMVEAANKAFDLLKKVKPRGESERLTVEEYRWTTKAQELLGHKALLKSRLDENGPEENHELAQDLIDWVRDARELFIDYEALWLARNKRSDLDEISRAMQRLYDQMLAEAHRLRGMV